MTCLATIPSEMEVAAHFLAKENGVVAGIALAEMVFHEVDPSLKVSLKWDYSFWVWIVFAAFMLDILDLHLLIRWNGFKRMEIVFKKD